MSQQIRRKLASLSSTQLEAIAKIILGEDHADFQSEAALIDALSKRGADVRRLLGVSENWFVRHNIHLYGAVSVIGLLVTIATLVLPDAAERPAPALSSYEEKRVRDRVFDIQTSPPVVLNESTFSRIDVDALPDASTEDEFSIRKLSVVLDMRPWQPLASVERTEFKSPVVRNVRQELRKTADTDVYRILTSTSGLDIFTQSASHEERAIEYSSNERFQFGPYRTRPKILEFDVSDVAVGENFVLEYASTYWNAYLADDQSWTGFGPNAEIDEAEYLVIFPPNKPFVGYKFIAANLDGTEMALPAQTYVLIDELEKKWIWWRVVDPNPKFSYVIDWEW